MDSMTPNKRTLKKRLLPVLATVSVFASACGGSGNTTSTDSAGPAEVLAFAMASIEDTSYSFEQGQRLETEVFGETQILGGDGPVVTGQVDGNESFITMHIGRAQASFFESFVDVAESMADEGEVPEEALDDFGDQELNFWIDEDVVVIDSSGTGGGFGSVGATDSSDSASVEDGPALIDVDRLNDLAGTEVDISDFIPDVNGIEATDPADFIAALSSIDELEEAGTDSINGVDVDVYIANVTRAEYEEAVLGQEAFAEIEAARSESLSELDPETRATLEELNANAPDVDITVMVDSEGRARKIITRVGLANFAGTQGVVETWQTYDNYGEDFDITPPDAVDVTEEAAANFNS